MSEDFESFQDVSQYGIEDDLRESFLQEHKECSIIWSTSEAWPNRVMHNYIWRQGHFWVTCTERRKRVAALRARPQSSVIVAGPGQHTVTAKTLATVHHGNSDVTSWFYPALTELELTVSGHADITDQARAEFMQQLDTPDRVVIEFKPIKWISFNGRKVAAFREGRWKPGQEWLG